MEIQESSILLYKSKEGNINLDVLLKNETIWLSQKSIAQLFNVNVPAISKHLKNIFIEGELDKEAVVSKMEITASDNKKYLTELYSLDAIIAVGYRVNSKKATEFRIWATNTLKEFILKGFVLENERLKNGTKFGKDYFDELLIQIREIRLSERRVYQKITDLFEITSSDYNKDSEDAYTFFKIVQNKLHFAITGKTAAELIYERVNCQTLNMGLTTWKNCPDGKIYKFDIGVAKNYLNKEEIEKLESLTMLFLNYAEDMVLENKIMTMKSWLDATDDLLKFRNKKILLDKGNVSNKMAIAKANEEYEKYRIEQDNMYYSSMDQLYSKYLKTEKNSEN